MPVDLSQRNFLTLHDYSRDEIHYLLDLAAQLKEEKAAGTEDRRLEGKNIALIFEKTSSPTASMTRSSGSSHRRTADPSGSSAPNSS